MKKERNSSDRLTELRDRAEQFINKAPSAVKKVPPRDVKNLVEELQIHQVELEMQNEELRRTQMELEQARDRYVDLYDFAPVGYFTISDKGMILEANLAGATMLGEERRKLINHPFSRFVHRDDQDIFYLHQKQLIDTKTRQGCELRLVKEDGTQFYGQLECVVIEDADDNIKGFRAALMNVDERRRAVELIEEGKKQWETTFILGNKKASFEM